MLVCSPNSLEANIFLALAQPTLKEPERERKGLLHCNGKQTDSEVIYWKIVPGDSTYESPITPHHGVHHDRYPIYDQLPHNCSDTSSRMTRDPFAPLEQIHHF